MADSRRRLYYSKGQTTHGLNTKGGEWMFTDNVEYIGQYHKYITDEVFSEASFVTGISRILIPYVDLEDKLSKFGDIGINIVSKFEYDVIKQITVTPSRFANPSTATATNKDRKIGYMLRYFAYKVNDGNITELSKVSYSEVGSKDGLDEYLWKKFTIKWKITGPEFDVMDSQNNIKESGIIDTNRRTVDLHSEDYPTLKSYITGYTAVTF